MTTKPASFSSKEIETLFKNIVDIANRMDEDLRMVLSASLITRNKTSILQTLQFLSQEQLGRQKKKNAEVAKRALDNI